MIPDYILRLMQSFNRSFINSHGEFIAHEYANEYFILNTCKDETDVKCKVLEWFSRAAFKSEPYSTRKKNEEFHRFMLDGINTYLHTSFIDDEIMQIYCKLGNACNHSLTVKFVESEYDISLLSDAE